MRHCMPFVLSLLSLLSVPSFTTPVKVPSTSIAEQAAATAFMRWFDDNGGVRAVTLRPWASTADGPSFRRFVAVADADIHEYDTTFSVPLDIVMWRGTALQTPNSRLRRLFETMEDSDVLELFLLRQAALGKRSKWEPYVSVLPRSVPLSCSFEPSGLDALQDPATARFAMDRHMHLYERYKSLSSAIRTAVQGTAPSKAAVHNHRKLWGSFEAYSWAASIVSSRSYSLRGDMYLIPMADMVSYKPKQTYREAQSGEHFLRYHRLSSPDGPFTASSSLFEVMADRDVPAHTILAEDYGDASNYVYLHHHGFQPPVNPFDCVQLPLPRLDEPMDPRAGEDTHDGTPPASTSDKLRLFRRLHVAPLISTCVREEALTEAARVYMALRHLTQGDAAHCHDLLRSRGRRSVEAVQLQCLDRPVLSKPAARELLDIAVKRLAEFPTTVDADAALLSMHHAPCANAGADKMLSKLLGSSCFKLTEHEELAITFRLSRKKLMKSVISYLKHVVDADADADAARVDNGGDAAPTTTDAAAATPANAAGSASDDGTDAADGHGAASPPSAHEDPDANPVQTYNRRLKRAVNAANQFLLSSSADRVVRGSFRLTTVPLSHDTHLGGPVADGYLTVRAVATEDLASGQPVVGVSSSAVLNSAAALRSRLFQDSAVWEATLQAFPADAVAGQRLARHQALLVHLVQLAADAHTSAAPNSRPDLAPSPLLHYHYMQLLPTAEAMASHHVYSSKDWSLLEGSGIHCEVQRRHAALQTNFETLQSAVLAKFPDLFPPSVFSRDAYMWAAAVVNTRALWWDNEPHIVPLMDAVVMEPSVAVTSGAVSPSPVAVDSSSGRWVVASAPNTTDLGRAHAPAVSIGELAAVALPLDRAELLVSFGRSPPVPELSLRDIDAHIAGGSVDPASNVSSSLHVAGGDCVWLELNLCPSNPLFSEQLVQLRQHMLFTSTVAGCVPIGFFADTTGSTGMANPEVASVVNFVKGATALHSDAAARQCLARLVRATPRDASVFDTSRGGGGDDEDVVPSPAEVAIQHFRRTEAKLWEVAATFGHRQPPPSSSSSSTSSSSPRLTICASGGSSCIGPGPPSKSVWQPKFGSTPSGRPGSAQGPSCGTCVSCDDLEDQQSRDGLILL